MAHENPFAPMPVPWNGQQARPYHNTTLPPPYAPQPVWPFASEYAPREPGPFDAAAPANPIHPIRLATPDTPLRFGHAGRGSRDHPPAKFPREKTSWITFGDGRERDQAERQKWEMDIKVDQLRKDMERSFKADLRDAVDDIRKEIQTSLSESQSEPGRVPSRMGANSGRGGYAGSRSARSVHGDRDVWAERDGEHQDVLMQEMASFMEGRRMLQPQDSTSGAAFRHGGTQGGRGSSSARGSRIDPELRSEVETIVYDILLEGSERGQRHHRRPSSRSVGRGTASDGYDPRPEAARSYPRDRYHYRDTRDGGANPDVASRFGPGRSPVHVTFDENDHTIPSAAPSHPADERPWVGVPPRSRRPRRPSHWAGGSSGEAVAMAHQDRVNNSQGNPARPLGRRGEHAPAAAMDEDEDAGELFTDDDESDNRELFPKREATYPEFPAGRPDLRYQLSRAPDPRPHLQRAGYR
ncbi:hypothetical protein CTA2_3799 [Colletotrichum tanaceti]|uniref:Uncharacterized protein n=1 Tax=Colletotrichum tanaceti TaxID=1306861 RepID=A0A4U6X256_9PEZI|nr:hypothetical protein CTA2_3799 [Colletotrichum tanaceti]TKW48839.1 hypothetical protein CTA1_1378 [Colletotrichum tanaceti]